MTTTQRNDASTSGRVVALLRGNTGVSVAIMVQSVAAYAFQMVAARLLGPEQYGGLAGLMAVLLVVAVAQLGIQATAARRISADPAQVAHIEDVVVSASVRISLGLGLVLLALSPLLWRLLRLDSLAPAVWLAIGAVPLAALGGYLGILQGERRWLPLGAVYLLFGVGRLVFGTAFILVRPSEGSAMAGLTVGLLPPLVLGWWALKRRRREHLADHNGEHDKRAVLRETLLSSQALLAFLVLSNADIVVARNVLDDRDAGLYAGGLILTKAVLFAPQFVVVVAFPAMATAAARRRALLRSLGLVAVCGAVSVLGVLLLSDVAMIFIGGAQYDDVRSRLWVFAVLGTFLAMLQLLVYSTLARQGTRSVWFVWLAVVALVTGALVAHTLDTLVVTVTAVDAVLLAVLLALSLYRMKDDAPTT